MDDNKYDFKNIEQPDECIIYGGYCGYPIDDCPNCPSRPENNDPWWGYTTARIGGVANDD